MKKVLVFYASYGGGHLSAAKSIKQYIEEHYLNTEVQMVDCMKYINKTVEKLTTGAYREMAKKVPKLWGKVYSASEKGVLGEISKDSNKLMASKLNKLLQDMKPDFVISTHPFSSQMTAYLKKKGKINCSLATVMTDFAMHEQWLIGHEYTEFFFVSNESMKEDIVKYGVASEKIHVTGIPMSSRFFEHFDHDEVCKLMELDTQKKVILFFGGGEFGLGKEKTVQVLRSLIQNVPNYQIVAISGKNEKMKEEFEKLVADMQATNRVKILGFTDKVPELMSISSVVVTKPGGLTTTESLASGLPLIIINPIPGQEEENAEFLERNGAGIWIRKEDNPDEVIPKLFANEERLNKMRENVKLLSRKNSTEEICKIVLESHFSEMN